MPARLEPLRPLVRRRHWYESWVWREWCFLRTVLAQFKWRLALFGLVLFGGGVAFHLLERRQEISLAEGIFFAWSLLFGEPPEAFPQSVVLQALFFVIPILGLTVIIEGLLQLSYMVQERKKNERGWSIIMASYLRDHIVLVGLGRLGWRVFKLLRELGEPVVVIEADGGNEFLEDVRRDGSPLLIGDARREQLLEDAHVRHARCIIMASDNDLANLEIALDARRISPDIRVVLRLFDQNLANKIREGLDIRLAMSQSALSAPAFTVAALDPSIVNSFVHDGYLVVTRRVDVSETQQLCRKTIAEVMEAHRVGVLEHRRGTAPAALYPSPSLELEPGDRVLLQGRFHDLEALVPRASGRGTAAGWSA
jgi:voltage-gated potassium channel